MPYVDTGHLSIYYEDCGAGGPPILLLHELGGSSESWSRVIPLLAARRRVIAVDMRCAGRTEKPAGAFTMAEVAVDLAAFLRTLALPPVDVIGAALGSLAGALLAIHHPGCVRRLMMCAVAPDMAGPTRQYLSERAGVVRTAGMRAVVESSLANSFPASHAAARASYRAIYLANDPVGYAELSLALARLVLSAADWGRIAVPSLVTSGAHDFLWPPPVGRQVTDLISGAGFEILTDAGHFPHLQAPEALARLALGFVAG